MESKYNDGFPDKVKKPSDGYFIAKRQMMFSLDGRLQVLAEMRDQLRAEGNISALSLILMEIEITEKIRTHLKGTLLWDASRGV